jgi:hypothetical protein
VSKHWPMLMRGPLVVQALAGRKTVTRRLDQRWLKAQTGDLIWVKETWAVDRSLDDVLPSTMGEVDVQYAADGTRSIGRASFDRGKTRVSIHMPKTISRLWLEVLSVRAEYLHAIEGLDVEREGVAHMEFHDCPQCDPGRRMCRPVSDVLVVAFAKLWNEINGPGAWDRNPVVARIEFRRVERPAP